MRIFILTFRQRGLHEGNRIKTCVASQFTFNTTYRRNAVTMPWLSDSGCHIRLNSQFTCTLCVSISWPHITSQFACAVGCPETVGTKILCNPVGYSIYPLVGRYTPSPHTLTLFKTNITDFPTLFKTELQFLIPCLRNLKLRLQEVVWLSCVINGNLMCLVSMPKSTEVNIN